MSQYLKLKKSNCKNCYKCIRHCPVKSIRFFENQAFIVEDECILCGQCFVVCPQNAKEIKNDIDTAKGLIAGGSPVIASIAPSFVANYEGLSISSVEKALKKLGFAGAEETAEGATVVKQKYDEMVEKGEQELIISSCCHSVNVLIQKHFPEVLPYLAKVVSPMQAHSLEIKKRNPEAKTVFIGPCISKKEEADDYPGIVDCVLTFEELSEWMKEAGVEFEPCEDPANVGGKARLFPTGGGVLKSMNCNNPDYTYVHVDGTENCVNVLREISEGKMGKCFIEMSACYGSCVSGPVIERNRHACISNTVIVDKYAKKDDFNATPLDDKAMEKDMKFIGVKRLMPGSKAIDEILRKMGKRSPADELNCGSCGYNTCREKAVAVYNGKADLSMCLPFLKEKAESFSDTIIKNTPNAIIVLNESLEVQQINKSALKLMNIANASDVLGEQVVRILDPLPFFDVIESGVNIHDKRIFLAEYNKYVEQTLIYDPGYHIVMSIMRDVTEEEKAKKAKDELSQSTIEITDKVIEKQMMAVQEIASLLGETTAETKIALTKLKESLNHS
ncbi:MAG: 4Fe-4S binding protein [Ruminococcaceae bacterium]|nr:4Fe-4S binding protein [Oscillospiraceae bacterium]